MANNNNHPTATPVSTKPVPSKNIKKLRHLFKFIAPYRWQAVFALSALIFTVAINLIIVQGIRYIIDKGFVGNSPEYLNQGAVAIIVLIVLMSVGTFLRYLTMTWLGERVTADIRKQVFAHLVYLHPAYFDTNRSGEIMSRLTTDTTLLQNIIGSSASMAMRSMLLFIGSVIMLFITNLKLSLIVVLAIPLLLFPVMIYGRRVRKLSRGTQDSIAEVSARAGESIQNIRTVQSFSAENFEQTAFNSRVEEVFAVAKKRIINSASLMMVVMLLIFSSIAIMLWVGGNDVLSGKMSAGDLSAFVIYAIMCASSIATVSEVFSELQRAAGATERLLELLNAENVIVKQSVASDVIDHKELSPVETQPSIRFNQVSFSYPSRPKQLALDNVSFHLQEGSSLALVGPSGAGKSTIFELIQRFYDPSLGNVQFGDQDIRWFDPQVYRQQIAVVPQQPTLFTGNVEYNIRYGNPDATFEEVKEAAIAAHAHHFIDALPHGYQTELGEKGVQLSGGQKQRIAIARALLKNPRVLLLDEATSALDSESERHVTAAINEIMQQRSTIIIAHRLSTIRHVDRIAVLDEGKLIMVGTHQQLLEDCPLYANLYHLQFEQKSEQQLV